MNNSFNLTTGARKSSLGAALLAVLLWVAIAPAEPIKQHPDNPHYFSFKSRPTVLITSAEHYGAVVNKDFDYVSYLDTLQASGLNYTRIYPGFLFESQDKFIKGNTLAPKPESLVLPWARSDQPGFRLGGNKYDLERWNPDYFTRLKDFLTQAARRDIVVEICFFNCQYEDTWPLSPLSIQNNIQGVGNCHFNDAQTLKHPDLVRAEAAYVQKLVEEANPFDNVILEICDEPILLGTPASEAGAWIRHMAEVVIATEAKLPWKHLLAQQVEGDLGGPCDLSADARITLITAQYVWEAMSQQLGGMAALDAKYGCQKPIELNETSYYPVWYPGDKVAASRVEAWEFIVGGGAGFNQLNGRFTVANPTGNTPDNLQVLAALKHLKDFIHSVDFLRMKPDRTVLASGVPSGAIWRSLSEPGKQYAIYLHHSKLEKGACYQVIPGNYAPKLGFKLPVGAYQFDWIDPASGKILRTDTTTMAAGELTLTAPPYTVDIALRIKSAKPE